MSMVGLSANDSALFHYMQNSIHVHVYLHYDSTYQDILDF